MAKRKGGKPKKKSGSKGRRVSGGSTDQITSAAVAIAAAVAGRFASNALPESVKKYSPLILTAGGFLLSYTAKNPIVKAAGMGLVVSGGTQLAAKAIPALAGIRRIAGSMDVPRLGAPAGDGYFPKPARIGQSFPKPSVIGKAAYAADVLK